MIDVGRMNLSGQNTASGMQVLLTLMECRHILVQTVGKAKNGNLIQQPDDFFALCYFGAQCCKNDSW